jgi:ABC-type transporter Mla subunit MlaD
MALQDLTPQLRTRLSRMERAVGWFVILATALLLFGFGYYIYSTAETKGWFLKKINYQTCVSSGAGLKLGDPVKLMGFEVGEITAIIPNDPSVFYNITIRFRVKVDQYNYQGYIWSDSKVKVNSGDFLGNRFLEMTKGVRGVPTINESTNKNKAPVGILIPEVLEKKRAEFSKVYTNEADLYRVLNEDASRNPSAYYLPLAKNSIYWLEPEESPALTDRLEKLANQVESALPNILGLTNQIIAVLANSADLTSNLNAVALGARPTVSNLAILTAQLNQPGALGEWLLPTNINQKLDSVLGGADKTLTAANTNLAVLAENLNRSLENLADITSNLNNQVQANTNILANISRTIVDADNLVQGLKRHWLLRSAFKPVKTNAPPVEPTLSPRQR